MWNSNTPRKPFITIFFFFFRYTVLLQDVENYVLLPVADLEGGVRGVVPPPLKFAKHMLYNVN